MKHVVAGNLGPQVFDFAGLGEETVSADIEVETLVVDGAGNSANVYGVALEHDHGSLLLG